MPHIIIVGAGVVGLILGQALKLQGIPFTILERDKSADGREQGWAITLHWALPLLEEMLSPELITRIKECRVNPEVAENDARDFKLINLRDCSEIFNTASGERWRVNRGRFRLALMDGLESNIQWDQHVKSVQHHDGFARVQCAKGVFHDADVVIGADGSNSAIRRILCPDRHEVTPLPYRMLGIGTQLTERQVAPLRSIDKLLFQGSEPGTGTFLYYSLLKLSMKEDSTCTVQINISWPKRLNEDKVFSDNASRLAAFKSRARDFAPCLKDAI
ncbi:FAD/NAD(P)-binding domain-containing protein, partial [Aureobasidium melanogenum]